jgi:hypothetical protein
MVHLVLDAHSQQAISLNRARLAVAVQGRELDGGSRSTPS